MPNKKSSSSIRTSIYPQVEKLLPKNKLKFRKCIGGFISTRNDSITSTMPIDRIYYTDKDRNEMLTAIGIEKNTIKSAILNTYYGEITSFNPRAAKDEVTVLMINVIRYFLLKNDTKNLELAMIYLAFSGKFYPSIHYMLFRKVLPQEYVMQYVINNMLNNKFALKSEGNLFGAIMLICRTWIKTYRSRFKTFSDEDVVYVISQLHSRIRSFMINIARAYYKAYANKDYITFDSDNEDPTANGGMYHLADSDTFIAERCVQKAMSYMATSGVDYKICKLCSNKTASTEEIKSILESILMDKQNMIQIRKLLRVLVYSYFSQTNKKTVLTMDFISYSITAKPNTKDKNILEAKEIVENWLNTGSALYRKRKHRLASKNDYNRAIWMYFAMLIYTANK